MKTRRKQVARAARESTKPKKAERKKAPIVEEEDLAHEPIEAMSELPSDGRRSRRSRPTPSWLLEQQNHDEIAKRRVLMVLRVLSGETPVTDAIEGTDISRQMYYQLEERALKAMLRALTPGTDSSVVTGPDPAMVRRMADLDAKVKQLEQEKRRAERMLYLTRKVVPSGPMKSNHRGRPSKASKLASGGSSGSPSSTTARNSTSSEGRAEDGTADSTRKRSAVEPYGGTAS